MLYTRKGDDGTTKSFSTKSGVRISKSSCQTESLGALDELNSFLGLPKIKSTNLDWSVCDKNLESIIFWVQNNLFIIQAEVAGADKKIEEIKIKEMEVWIDAIEKELKFIIQNNLTVAGFHYSLDAQSDFGNNATIISELGAKMTGETYYDQWGYVAEFETPILATDLADKLSLLTSHDIFTVFGGPKKVKRIGVCSGGAKPYDRELWEIIDKKIDAHIAGEIIEASVGQAMGVGYNYYSCGHYATEVFGVQELGKKIKEHFKNKLEVEFIDIPNIL
jgi:putative NIF3 family GTP cyclohydrolase 1 type 2